MGRRGGSFRPTEDAALERVDRWLTQRQAVQLARSGFALARVRTDAEVLEQALRLFRQRRR